MASGGYGKKKTFKEKLSAAFKRATRVTAVVVIGGAAIGLPGYNHYGTIEEEEVRVRSVERGKYVGYDYETGKSNYEGDLTMVTDKGPFRNESSVLHLKSENEAKAMHDEIKSGRTYAVKSYGGIFGDRNILSVREITAEEQRERQKLAEEERKRKEQEQASAPETQTPPQNPQQPAEGASAATPALSGATRQVIITAHGYDVKLTVPAEVVDKIKVESVKESEPVRIVQPPSPPTP